MEKKNPQETDKVAPLKMGPGVAVALDIEDMEAWIKDFAPDTTSGSVTSYEPYPLMEALLITVANLRRGELSEEEREKAERAIEVLAVMLSQLGIVHDDLKKKLAK